MVLLADSTGMITNALVKAAEQVGLPALDPSAASNIIGLGLKESIFTLFGELPAEKAQALAKQYNLNYYAGEAEIPLFSRAKETIVELHRRGFKLAVATGKGRRGLNMALEKKTASNPIFTKLKQWMNAYSKPHPQMLDELIGWNLW